VIRRADQLGAVISPLRHQMVRLMSVLGPCTVKDLAVRLGRSPEALYYHIRALQRVGLVQEKEKRPGVRRPEVVYDLVARTLLTDPEQTDPDYLRNMARSAGALLRLADRHLQVALEDQAATGTRRPGNLRIQQYQARLSPRSIRELNRKLDELCQFLEDADDPEVASLTTVTLTTAPTARTVE
jgi:predicted ArsR family transcriptional regulator